MITYLLTQPLPSQKSLVIQLLLNFIIATVILLALPHAENIFWFQRFKDSVLDQRMSWQIGIEPRLADGRKMQPLAFIEIDDRTYRQWGFAPLYPSYVLLYSENILFFMCRVPERSVTHLFLYRLLKTGVAIAPIIVSEWWHWPLLPKRTQILPS